MEVGETLTCLLGMVYAYVISLCKSVKIQSISFKALITETQSLSVRVRYGKCFASFKSDRSFTLVISVLYAISNHCGSLHNGSRLYIHIWILEDNSQLANWLSTFKGTLKSPNRFSYIGSCKKLWWYAWRYSTCGQLMPYNPPNLLYGYAKKMLSYNCVLLTMTDFVNISRVSIMMHCLHILRIITYHISYTQTAWKQTIKQNATNRESVWEISVSKYYANNKKHY